MNLYKEAMTKYPILEALNVYKIRKIVECNKYTGTEQDKFTPEDGRVSYDFWTEGNCMNGFQFDSLDQMVKILMFDWHDKEALNESLKEEIMLEALLRQPDLDSIGDLIDTDIWWSILYYYYSCNLGCEYEKILGLKGVDDNVCITDLDDFDKENAEHVKEVLVKNMRLIRESGLLG